MKTEYAELLKKTNVVGVVASDVDLNHAYTLPVPPHQGAFTIDMLEIRLDKVDITDPKDSSFRRLLALNKPLILTPRDASQHGGRLDWTIKDRRRLYLAFMPFVAMIDVEASMLGELKEIIVEAKRQGAVVIVSHHDFEGIPTYAEMIALAVRCKMFGGDILKFAVNIRDTGDLSEITDAVTTIRSDYPFKVTSMGTEGQLGQYYRMIDALSGSPLIYGYLVKQASSGQIKASRIKQLMKELK